MDNLYKPFVLYDVKTQFGKYGVSGDDWIPGRKGTGNIEGGYKSDGAKSNQTHPMNHTTGKTYVMEEEFNSDYAPDYTAKKDGSMTEGVPSKGEVNRDGGYD